MYISTKIHSKHSTFNKMPYKSALAGCFNMIYAAQGHPPDATFRMNMGVPEVCTPYFYAVTFKVRG